MTPTAYKVIRRKPDLSPEVNRALDEWESARREFQLNQEVVLTLESGKYAFRKDAAGLLRCDRYAESWRDFLGDKAVSALFDHAVELHEALPLLIQMATHFLNNVGGYEGIGEDVYQYREAVKKAEAWSGTLKKSVNAPD